MPRRAGVRTSRVALLAAPLVLAVLARLAVASPVEATSARASRVASASGDLAALVAAEERAMPRRGSEGYDLPTPAEAAAMADAWEALVAGDLERAATLADRHSYEVVRYSDTGTSPPTVLLLLRERPRADGSLRHAWGLYTHAPGRSSTVVVEVAHPVHDVHTPAMGVESFRRAAAGALLLAGAHRYANADGSADVAHRSDSVFEAVHRRLMRPGVRVVQPHGFDESGFDASYGEAVVSRGDRPSDLTSAVAGDLAAGGFEVCVYDGATACSRLAATTNVQGASARSVGAEFVHVEVARVVRDDGARRSSLGASLAATLAGAPPA